MERSARSGGETECRGKEWDGWRGLSESVKVHSLFHFPVAEITCRSDNGLRLDVCSSIPFLAPALSRPFPWGNPLLHPSLNSWRRLRVSHSSGRVYDSNLQLEALGRWNQRWRSCWLVILMGEQERRMATKFACHSHRALSSHCLFLLFVFDLLFASDQNTHQLHNAHTLPPLPHLPLDIQRHSHPWPHCETTNRKVPGAGPT